jgi:hypothetical protein
MVDDRGSNCKSHRQPLAGGRDDPRGEVAQLAEALEIAPAQRGAGGPAEQRVAEAARAKPQKSEEAADDERQARRFCGFDQAELGEPPAGGKFAPYIPQLRAPNRRFSSN